MKIESHYDWVVIGEHPAALLSGCLAARLGLRVLSVPFFRRSSGFLSHSGQYIDLESNRVLMIGKTLNQEGEVPFLEKLMLQLCEIPDLSRSDFLIDRKVTIETPDLRKNLNQNEAAANHHWVDSWAASLEMSGEEQKKTTPVHAVSPVEDLLVQKALFTLFSNQEFKVDADAFSRLCEISANWVSFRGGRMAYQRLLRLQGTKWGVHFANENECRRIFTKDGRISGVQLSGMGEMVTTQGAALGVPLDMIRETVHGKIENSPPASFWKMTLALSVADAGFSPGISEVYIWQEPESAAIEIEWASPKDYGMRLEGIRYVFLRTELPYTSESLRPEYQRKMAARMYKKFQELFPFVERHVVKMFPDFQNSLDEFSEAYGYAAIEMIPEFLKTYQGNGVSVRSGIEGLFVANSEAYPELGDFGGTRSAVEAVTWLAHQSGLKGVLL